MKSNDFCFLYNDDLVNLNDDAAAYTIKYPGERERVVFILINWNFFLIIRIIITIILYITSEIKYI